MDIKEEHLNISARNTIVLAALLHDIGKFWERSDNHYSEAEIIKKEFPNDSFGHTVPLYKEGAPMYGHALWTQAFINNYKVDEFLGLLKENDNNLATISARHHLRQGSHLEQIIALADKWSSSIDRPDEGEEGVLGYTEVKNKWGESFNKKVPLMSIFDKIKVNEKSGVYGSHCYNIEKLNILDKESIIPKITVVNKNDSLKDTYKNHWNSFVEEFEKLKRRNKEFNSFYFSLDDLLKKYLWCIPSATNTEPADVSLYEHLKTTAAIAACLYDYYEAKNKKIDYKDNKIKGEDCLLMTCIDLSGIQKFIFDIANKKAAKSLKGRSFYLQLLMQAAIDKILYHHDINLYTTNVIYASGGKAYLLLPNTEKAKKALEGIKKEIEDFIFKTFHGSLYISLATLSFGYETFLDVDNKWRNKIQSTELTDKELNKLNKQRDQLDLGDLWRLVSDRASQNKQKKFLPKILDYSIFEVKDYVKEAEKCAVTGINYPKSEMKILNEKEEDGNEIFVSKIVDDQIRLGQKLKECNFIKVLYEAENANFDIEILGIKYQLITKETLKSFKNEGQQKVVVYALNQTEFDYDLDNVGVKTIFYGGNVQPYSDNGDVKTYEDIAKIGIKNTKLGILRMDVDNLGQIFINGFEAHQKSFAAYATLSFMLEAFFCGYINQIRDKKEYKDYIQVLYSGGDDLFVVGKWDSVIDFADTINSEFKRFTKREDITISGGIAIVGSKYPISKSAELAGEAEKKAKENNKNTINFFGQNVKWGDEFDYVKSFKHQSSYFEGDASKSILHSIQNFKLQKDKRDENENRDFSYIWQSAYKLSRMLERIKDKESPNYGYVDSIRKNILHNNKFGSEKYLDLIAVGARWAEYFVKYKNN
jgi:CRISPR-associated protein Csm1